MNIVLRLHHTSGMIYEWYEVYTVLVLEYGIHTRGVGGIHTHSFMEEDRGAGGKVRYHTSSQERRTLLLCVQVPCHRLVSRVDENRL